MQAVFAGLIPVIAGLLVAVTPADATLAFQEADRSAARAGKGAVSLAHARGREFLRGALELTNGTAPEFKYVHAVYSNDTAGDGANETSPVNGTLKAHVAAAQKHAAEAHDHLNTARAAFEIVVGNAQENKATASKIQDVAADIKHLYTPQNGTNTSNETENATAQGLAHPLHTSVLAAALAASVCLVQLL